MTIVPAKSVVHFYNLQCLSDRKKIKIARVYGIAGHGKGEVDHVGGMTKGAVRQEVAAK